MPEWEAEPALVEWLAAPLEVPVAEPEATLELELPAWPLQRFMPAWMAAVASAGEHFDWMQGAIAAWFSGLHWQAMSATLVHPVLEARSWAQVIYPTFS